MTKAVTKMRPDPPLARARTRRTVALVLIALALTSGLLAWKLRFLSNVLPVPKSLNVIVVGHSWWWEFDYPDLGIKTANELHVPIGTDIQMELVSADVLHTLSIPELSIKADAIPGQINHLQTRADEPGELGGQCSEVCGTAHALMRVKVIADSQDDFEVWSSNQQKPAAAPQTNRQRAGYNLVTTACAACHSLDPAEQRPDLIGPNLAHLMSRSVFAGASFTLNESNLRRWIGDTQAMKAGNIIAVKLPRDDFDSVIEYLLLLK
jgi:cytochrome c oxidase subunit 2